MTPFNVVYGKDPPTLLRYSPSPSDHFDVHQQLLARDVLLDKLKHNLLKAQACMEKYANAHRTEMQLEVGGLVFVKLQP